MTTDQPKKSRFEPPPWEQEAFENFRQKQDALEAQAELDAALRAVRDTEAQAQPASGPTESEAAGSPVEPTAAAPKTAVPDAKIDSMLIQLRGEERPSQRAGKGLVYGVIAFMAIFGAYIIIRSALVFKDGPPTSGAGTLLAATLSFMVFATGIGFLGGAFLLFRKYRQ